MKKHFRKPGAMLIAVLMLVSMFSTTAFADVTSLPNNTTERVLNIYKYSPSTDAGENGDGTVNEDAATDRVPLENVEFEIYKVPVGQTTSATPSADEIAAIKIAGNLVTTVKTNPSGLATYSFGEGNAKDGIYMIVEKDNVAVLEKVDPFYVNIPLTNPDENAWLYTVTVYPKNDVPQGPEVDKDIDSIGEDSGTSDIGDIHTWIIRGDVPEDLYRELTDGTEVYAKNYSFTDEIDTRLDYKGGLAVKLYTKAGTEIALDPAHYTTADTTAVVDSAGGTLKVALTQAGMKYISESLSTGDKTPEIRVYFDTAINDTAVVATEIPNDVTLDYTNSSNKEYEGIKVPEGEKPEVHMGGLVIDKYEKGKSTSKLAGAKFKIARDAKDGETSADTIMVNGVEKEVVYVDFYDTDDIEGSRVDEVTTGTNGKAVINGLAYGDYYLVETKAPDGYNLLSAPVAVTIDDESHLTANEVKIENSAKFILPVTGGTGTIFFTMGGILLIGAAAVLIISSKKKKVNE